MTVALVVMETPAIIIAVIAILCFSALSFRNLKHLEILRDQRFQGAIFGTIQVRSAFARRSPSCLGDRIKAVSVSSMGSDCFRALAMTLLRSQKALA